MADLCLDPASLQQTRRVHSWQPWDAWLYDSEAKASPGQSFREAQMVSVPGSEPQPFLCLKVNATQLELLLKEQLHHLPPTSPLQQPAATSHRSTPRQPTALIYQVPPPIKDPSTYHRPFFPCLTEPLNVSQDLTHSKGPQT